MDRHSILHLYEFNRTTFVRMFDALPDNVLYTAPAWDDKHPCWLIGHLTVTSDLALQWMQRESLCSPQWHDTFGHRSRPVSSPSGYPNRTALLQQYNALHRATAEAFLQAEDSILLSPMPMMSDIFANVYEGVVCEMLSHEGVHSGQLRLIWNHYRKMKDKAYVYSPP